MTTRINPPVLATCLGFAVRLATSHRGQNRLLPKRRIKQPNKQTPDRLTDKPPDTTKDTHHHADAHHRASAASAILKAGPCAVQSPAGAED